MKKICTNKGKELTKKRIEFGLAILGIATKAYCFPSLDRRHDILGNLEQDKALAWDGRVRGRGV